MTTTKKLHAVALLALLTNSAYAVLTLSIYDDGTDLYMSASGSYDFSALTPVRGEFLGTNAVVTNFFNGIYGWDTGSGDSDAYSVTITNPLTISGSQIGATTASANFPFYISIDDEIIVIPEGASKTATGIDNTAMFENLTLADLGMIPGEAMSITWDGGSVSIATSVIPEPTTYAALLAVSALGMAVWSRRRSRRLQ